MHPMAYLALNAPDGSKRPQHPQNGPFWPTLRTKIRNFFSFQILFSDSIRSNTLKDHILDHWITLNDPCTLSCDISGFQKSVRFCAKRTVSALPAPGTRKALFSKKITSPGHIWDGPQWFMSHQNDKMHTVACT